jgi:hypothetical protein
MHIRRFLNRKGFHSGGHVIAFVDDTSRFTDDQLRHGTLWVDAEVTIADCNRSVTLDFSDVAGTAAERANALRKADILIETLTEFRAALAVEADLAAARTRRKGRSG